MAKKYVMLLGVMLVIIMFTSANTARIISPLEKIYEKLPEKSLLRKLFDRIFLLQNNLELWRKNRINSTKYEQYNSILSSDNTNNTLTNYSTTEIDSVSFGGVLIENDTESDSNIPEETDTGSGETANEGGFEEDPSNSEETGSLSGRLMYDENLMIPAYDATVSINGNQADIYGATYLASGVVAGDVTIQARDSNGQIIEKIVTVKPSIVNIIDLIFSIDEQGSTPVVSLTSTYLRCLWDNGLSIDLVLSGSELKGIGQVKVNNVALRKSTTTILPKIEKISNGNIARVIVKKCLYLSYETFGEALIVHSKLTTTEGEIYLDWIFNPWEKTVNDNLYIGLGYRFSISSPINISKMEFKCSWELNENINGKKLLTRRENTYWERYCTLAEGFKIKSISLLSQHQPPDYQFDSNGALASFIWPPAEVDNTLQKDSNSVQLWSIDKFSFGNTMNADTPYRVVIFCNIGGLDEYTYLFDKISKDYRDFYGLEEVTPKPTVLANTYIRNGKLGSQPFYRKLADNYLPELFEHNFKQALIIDVWLSNGRIGYPYNGNRLATHSIDIHPDDVEELKYLVNKAHDYNMDFTVWLSTCFSIYSPLFGDDYDWAIMNLNGTYPTAVSGDVYLMNYKSGYLAYAIERLESIKEEFGFNGIWHDSFGAATKIDYSDEDIRPSIDQQMQFLSALQHMNSGYSPYLESLGPFGMAASGTVSITPPGSPRGDRDINNAFGGREYLTYKTSFILFHSSDFSPLQLNYYKYIANKAVPMITYSLLDEDEQEVVSRSNYDYNEVSNYMDKRHLLSDDNGVLWYDTESNTQVLFAYKEFSCTLEEGLDSVFDITNNSIVVITNGSFTTQTNHTYRLE